MCYRKFLIHKNKLFLLVSLILVAVLYQFKNNPVDQTSFDVVHHLQQVNLEWSAAVARFKYYAKHLLNLEKSFENAKRLARPEGFVQAHCKELPFLLVLVHSKPNHFLNREAIRYSWARLRTQYKRSSRVIFLLGQTNDTNIIQMLDIESSKSRDLVMGDFKDSYENLYTKMLLSISWSLHNCPAKYILKTDEDCYVNMDILLSYLVEYDITNGSRPLYTGREAVNEIERDPKKQHYVSIEIYPSRQLFPPYISGGGYLFSGSLLKKLYKVSKRSPLFAVEDACFGSLMSNIGVKPTDNFRFMPFLFCYLFEMQEVLERPLCEFLGPIVMHGFSPLEMINMHYRIKLITTNPSICQGNENAWLTSREKCG